MFNTKDTHECENCGVRIAMNTGTCQNCGFSRNEKSEVEEPTYV